MALCLAPLYRVSLLDPRVKPALQRSRVAASRIRKQERPTGARVLGWSGAVQDGPFLCRQPGDGVLGRALYLIQR